MQDQAAFTILVLNRSLPLVNTCPYIDLPSRRGYEPQRCVRTTKHPAFFLGAIRTGAFEVVNANEYDALREGYLDTSVASRLPYTDSLHGAKRAVARTASHAASEAAPAAPRRPITAPRRRPLGTRRQVSK